MKRKVATVALAAAAGVSVAPASVALAKEVLQSAAEQCKSFENVNFPPEESLHCSASFIGQMAIALESDTSIVIGLDVLVIMPVIYVGLGAFGRKPSET